MRAVNLLPKDDPRGKSRGANPVAIGAVMGLIAMTGILAAWFLATSTGVADKQERLDAAQAELDATPVPPPVPTGSALGQEKGQRITALSTALSKRLAWDRILRELSLVLPEDVWLSTLSAKAPVDATGTAAGFTITGKTYSHDGVARLLARLAVIPHLTRVQLQNSSLSTSEGGGKVVEFSIQASVKPPGVAS